MIAADASCDHRKCDGNGVESETGIDPQLAVRNHFNRGVDADGDTRVSESELREAAKNSKLFDPISRRSLRFGLDHFDKISKMAPKDSNIFGNAWSWTKEDLFGSNYPKAID